MSKLLKMLEQMEREATACVAAIEQANRRSGLTSEALSAAQCETGGRRVFFRAPTKAIAERLLALLNVPAGVVTPFSRPEMVRGLGDDAIVVEDHSLIVLDLMGDIAKAFLRARSRVRPVLASKFTVDP